MGELARALVKGRQNIRGYGPEKAAAEKMDAIGDVVIYLMGVCDLNGWDFQEVVAGAVEVVSTRDWIRFPNNGRTE